MNLREFLAVQSLEELGRRYGERLRDRLDAANAAHDGGVIADGLDSDSWIDEVEFNGEGLTDDEYFVVILAALDAVAGHRGALWCIGDGPMDHLVGRDDRLAQRFHAERGRESVAAAFRLMQEYLDGLDAGGRGWWGDEFA